MSTNEKNPTVRRQKTRKNHRKARLLFFLFLTAALLLVVIFAQQICPYDPNAQDTGIFPFAAQSGTSGWNRPLWA